LLDTRSVDLECKRFFEKGPPDMERRRAVAIAAATVLTTLGAAAAFAVNVDLLDSGAPPNPTGQLDAGRVVDVGAPAATPNTATTGAAPNVVVRYEDIYLPAPQPATAPPAQDPGAVVADDTGAATSESETGGYETGGYETGEDDDHDEDHDGSREGHDDHDEDDD
jgi:hypothetical protein